MVDPNKWGKKFTCFKCGCKFYDLNRPLAVCPKCGTDQAEAHDEVVAIFEEEEIDDDKLDDDDEAAATDDDELPAMEEDLGYDEVETEEDEP